VYNRFHHGVDVLAGFTVAAVAAGLGYWVTEGYRARRGAAA
jgi:membrane-associated phospholipid phosphatase